MKSRTVSGIVLTLLLISMVMLAFYVQTVKTESGAAYVDDDHIARSWDKERKIVRVVEHEITFLELEKLKQVGVWEEDRDYNQIIDGHGTGLRPPAQEEWAKILEQTYVVDEILWMNQMAGSPSSVDHTTSLWFPPIGDQDGEGSCVAWAVGYYMKTFQEAKEHGWNLSEAVWEDGYKGHPTEAYQDRIFSPDFIYHQINNGNDAGSYFSDALNLVRSIGVCSWEKMPYDPDNSDSWPSEEAWREAPLYRGNSTGIRYMDLETDVDILDLKNWIASDHLAVIAVDAGQYSSLTSEDIWTLDSYLNPVTNHANTIVGYDDNIEYTEGGELSHGAFKIANSWGEGGWENIADGCYWISYEAMKQRVRQCMFFMDRIGYDPKLVASFKMDHSKRGECDITFGIGNKSAPVQTKRFDNWKLDGGNHPFCSNNIVLDITEFKDAVPAVINQSFFIKVYDGGSSTTGIISSFSTEYYSSYSTGTLRAKSTSFDVPVDTSDQDYVFAELVLDNIWTVNDDGSADFRTIREAIDIAIPRDTVYVYNGTYVEDVVVNKSISLVGENKETTIIYGSGKGTVVYVSADNVNISRFTIRNSSHWDFDGGIYLKNSHGCSVEGNEIQVSGSGIIVSGGHGNHLINNRIGPEYSWCGIHLINSSGNMIVGNVQLDSDVGIRLEKGSCGNNISNNFIAHNMVANIVLRSGSDNNSITNNELERAPGGIILDNSDRNSIYHNNFYGYFNNSVFVDHASNIWDDGYPNGGNYWSDHNPPDMYSGTYQNETGRDGIGDIPYIIDGNNADRFPLEYPYGYVPSPDVNEDGVVDIVDIATCALAFGSKPADPEWNPVMDLNQDGLVDIVDVVMVAIHFGETW